MYTYFFATSFKQLENSSINSTTIYNQIITCQEKFNEPFLNIPINVKL